jgi:hypothetical protein
MQAPAHAPSRFRRSALWEAGTCAASGSIHSRTFPLPAALAACSFPSQGSASLPGPQPVLHVLHEGRRVALRSWWVPPPPPKSLGEEGFAGALPFARAREFGAPSAGAPSLVSFWGEGCKTCGLAIRLRWVLTATLPPMRV